MGYNNNHAGIHPVSKHYKYKTDVSAPYDKYAVMMAEKGLSDDKNNTLSTVHDTAIMKEKEERNHHLYAYIVKHYNVAFLDKKSKKKTCICGGTLNPHKVGFLIEEEKVNLKLRVECRECADCKKVYVVKTDLLNALNKAL